MPKEAASDQEIPISTGGCGMKMYLHWDWSYGKVFFSFWTAETPKSFAMTLLAVFVLAAAYEGVINSRSRYDVHLIARLHARASKKTPDPEMYPDFAFPFLNAL